MNRARRKTGAASAAGQPRRRELELLADTGGEGHMPCACGEFTRVYNWRLLNALPASASPVMCEACGHWMADVVAARKAAESLRKQ